MDEHVKSFMRNFMSLKCYWLCFVIKINSKYFTSRDLFEQIIHSMSSPVLKLYVHPWKRQWGQCVWINTWVHRVRPLLCTYLLWIPFSRIRKMSPIVVNIVLTSINTLTERTCRVKQMHKPGDLIGILSSTRKSTESQLHVHGSLFFMVFFLWNFSAKSENFNINILFDLNLIT